MSYKDDRFRIDTKSEEYKALSSQTHAKVEGEMTPSEAWYCMEEQVKNAYKVEDGLRDVIERLEMENQYLSMAYDSEVEIVTKLGQEIDYIKRCVSNEEGRPRFLKGELNIEGERARIEMQELNPQEGDY